MNTEQFLDICKTEIVNYYASKLKQEIKTSDIFTVWACKTLQNTKALLSTTIPDHRYFECTFNGDLSVMYLDSYVKECNMPITVAEKE